MTAAHQGIGRMDDNTIDQFVVTRKVNYTELIFNQKIKNDKTKFKYFQKDHSLLWTLSKKNECFICEKYKYTMVFFEKGIMGKNPELTEINDEEFLGIIKKDFNNSNH